MKHKILLYISSMTLFFVIVLILSFSPCENLSQTTKYCALLIAVIRWSSIVLIAVGLLYYLYMEFIMRDSSFNQSIEIEYFDSCTYENLSFLASYFVPLVSFNLLYLSHTIVMVLLVISIGVIFVQSGKYYTNPTLALFGYRVYKVSGKTKALTEKERTSVSYMVIVRGQLSKGDWLETLKIEEGFYYSKLSQS